MPDVGKMVAQYRNRDFVDDIDRGMAVEALGNESIGGKSTKVCAYTVTRPTKSDATTRISQKTGLPLQTESTSTFMGHTATVRVRYSGLDDPSIRIDARH